ncbi:DUF1566 domain-containing protein [Ectothiorhodospiraceae bacterium BW-2]|nr:DUF1566 domain-containing protein [Ectothiorhodospiraceae bacterium BW-2]
MELPLNCCANATVKILNITPRYQTGMELPDGDYDVLIQADGYNNWRQTITHRGRATYQRVELQQDNRAEAARLARQRAEQERLAQLTPQPPTQPVPSALIDNRYRDNGDGTVTDVKTKLMWQRCSVGQTWSGSGCSGKAKKFKWEKAKALTDRFAGHNDWRTPTIQELNSLVYCSNGQPGYYPFVGVKDEQDGCDGESGKDYQRQTIHPQAFPDTLATHFWSSSPSANDSYNSWIVVFNYGYAGVGSRDFANSVRLVRAGQ